MLYKFNEFEEYKDRESITRSKPVSEDEFIQILNENCKNFSFDNDQLWRNKTNEYEMSLFIESSRKGTIGNYNYKDFFDDRKGYPVPRYKSLIGSTFIKGAEQFSTHGTSKADSRYLVIPFDNSQIVFACVPDMVFLDRYGIKEYSDDMFIMSEYNSNFKVPNSELERIHDSLDKPNKSYRSNFSDEYGFEFFTNGPCLLLRSDKIDWLKNFV